MSKKGQVTIPKQIRNRLKIGKEGGILFLIEGDEVKLKGLPGAHGKTLAGSLKGYAKKYVPLKEVRKEINGRVAHEISREGLPD